MIFLVTGSRFAVPEVHGAVIRGTLLRFSDAVDGGPEPDHELWEGSAHGADVISRHLAVENFGWTNRPFAANWPDCDPDWVDPIDKVKPCTPGHRKVRSNGVTPFCPTAGFRRNQMMVDRLREEGGRKLVIAFPIPQLGSSGTWDCIERAAAAELPIFIRPMRPAEPLPGKER